jgi:hypothetical protein
MKSLRFAYTILLLVCLAASGARAALYQAGESVAGLKMKDQQGAKVTFEPGEVRFILFDTPGESGPSESPQDPDWFKRNQALIVVNLSEFSGFKRRIAWSRIKEKPFRIWAVEDATVAARFPKEEGKFTVVQLDEKGKIVAIRFAAPGKELKEMVEANRAT